ncbi:PRC-barrel domain-containing protein [Sphingomonas xanthus]|uniref:PRC-barrel domain containing protein n=1 Tax=Sphingomonas xanthus TaxID=2594473 RepID=A0A516IRF8_9SPHN|nr:PRC-barrel domain-containing protein [Sphingomonas xanthus]QDP19493.1 PRC-barrel domain containing protein [Sphingomonas xanthus]
MTTTTQTRDPDNVLERDETLDLIASDKVEGTSVHDRDGEKVGTVRKVMIGKYDGQVRYVVMGMGGLFGMGEDNFPLPWDGLDYDKEIGGYKLKNVAKADFQKDKAPRHGLTDEPQWSKDYDDRIQMFYLRTA